MPPCALGAVVLAESEAVALPEVVALPIGDETSLAVGDEVVLLGYGRAGRGGPPSATNTRGVFAGGVEHPTTGAWLRTDALMLSGHSGGPLLNRRGEVVGWSVRSGFDKVVNGDGFYAAGLNEVRPASALLAHVSRVLGGRPPVSSLPAGTFVLGALEAREAVMAALAHAFGTVASSVSHAARHADSDDDDHPRVACHAPAPLAHHGDDPKGTKAAAQPRALASPSAMDASWSVPTVLALLRGRGSRCADPLRAEETSSTSSGTSTADGEVQRSAGRGNSAATGRGTDDGSRGTRSLVGWLRRGYCEHRNAQPSSPLVMYHV